MDREKQDSQEKDPSLEINLAKPGDSPGIANVRKLGWTATYPPNPSVGITLEDVESTPFSTNEKLAEWEEDITHQGENHQIWVAREGGEIIAYCFAKKVPKPEIEGLYVLPDRQGGGVGKILLKIALKWLEDKDKVAVWIFSGNTLAQNFYERHGFVVSGTTAEPEVNGRPIPALELIRHVRNTTQQVLEKE